MAPADLDLWDALGDLGHVVGARRVDGDGVLWVMVDGAPLCVESARKLLRSAPAGGPETLGTDRRGALRRRRVTR